MPREEISTDQKEIKDTVLIKELITTLPEKPETGSVKIFPWEKAWIRKPNPKNPKDIDDYLRIEAQKSVKKNMSDIEEP